MDQRVLRVVNCNFWQWRAKHLAPNLCGSLQIRTLGGLELGETVRPLSLCVENFRRQLSISAVACDVKTYSHILENRELGQNRADEQISRCLDLTLARLI